MSQAAPHRTDRWFILGGLGAITTIAWIYLVLDRGRMTMPAMDMKMSWTGTEFGLRLVMWAVMMVAMMVPTAVPMTLVYAQVARKAAGQANPVAPTFVFVGGYLSMWALFSVVAVAAQRGLDQVSLLSPAMASNSPRLGGALLIGAGIYQLTPLKQACLKHCRAPAHFISQHWRSGAAGSYRMGIEFGAYCVGCCWILMALLFVGGVMNFVWIVAIAIFILLEKTIPLAETGGRIIGAALIVIGLLSVTGIVPLS